MHALSTRLAIGLFCKRALQRDSILQKSGCKHRRAFIFDSSTNIGWLWLVGSKNYRSLLQKSPVKRQYSAQESYNLIDPTN